MHQHQFRQDLTLLQAHQVLIIMLMNQLLLVEAMHRVMPHKVAPRSFDMPPSTGYGSLHSRRYNLRSIIWRCSGGWHSTAIYAYLTSNQPMLTQKRSSRKRQPTANIQKRLTHLNLKQNLISLIKKLFR